MQLYLTGFYCFSFVSQNNVNEEGNVQFDLEELAPGTLDFKAYL